MQNALNDTAQELIALSMGEPPTQGDEIFDTMSDIGALFYFVYLIVFFVAVVIGYVGCWRSAAKYIATKIKKKKSAFWGYTAYVLIAISTVRVFASIITEF